VRRFTEYYDTVPHSLIALVKTKNPLLSNIEKNRNQKDSNFNTDKNKLQYLAVLPPLIILDNTFNLGISLSNLSTFYQNTTKQSRTRKTEISAD
jgi:hypothetical protein